MKSSSVRGTPVRSISANNGQGFNNGGKPAGMSGTVSRQFEGDQKGNAQVGIATGTPYQSSSVNDDKAPKTARAKYGMVTDQNGDQASPTSNGNGTLFDGVSREGAYLPPAAGAMDSPVTHGAPALNPGAIRVENLAHLGQGIGASPSQASDEILKIGGVMSRGMQGKSHASGGEEELLEDDVLRNLGPGGAVG